MLRSTSCSLSLSHVPPQAGAQGVLTHSRATRPSWPSGNALRSSAIRADRFALDHRPGGLAVQVGHRPSSPRANHSQRADANAACDVQCPLAVDAGHSSPRAASPLLPTLPLTPTAGTLFPTAVEPIARIRAALGRRRRVELDDPILPRRWPLKRRVRPCRRRRCVSCSYHIH